MTQAIARAHANIAFIKYWGNSDDQLRIPVNSSISMNLDGLYSETTVHWRDDLDKDTLMLNGEIAGHVALQRVSRHLDAIRERLGLRQHASVVSMNNFPMGAGIASSASSFAALTQAAISAVGADLTERELTTIARLGSGSASRSIPTGFVVWHQGDSHETSYAETFKTPDHWDLVDVIAVVSDTHKKTGSTEGHHSATTSDLQSARVSGAQARLDTCMQAIADRDFATFADVVELDSNLMHAVMMTSRPPLFYWAPTTLTIMNIVRDWRAEGLEVCYTLDAGPNVHCICVRKSADTVRERLSALSGVKDVRIAQAGIGAHTLS